MNTSTRTSILTIPAMPALQIQVRHQYGVERLYPMNSTAALFCSLLERKTFVRRDLAWIQALGFELEWIAEEPK